PSFEGRGDRARCSKFSICACARRGTAGPGAKMQRRFAAFRRCRSDEAVCGETKTQRFSPEIQRVRRRSTTEPAAAFNSGANFCCRFLADAANGLGWLNQKVQSGGRLFGGEGRLAALDLQTGRLLLARPHLGIDAAAGEELAMVAAFDDAAGFNDEDLVGVDYGRQAMRDGQGRVPGRYLGEVRLDFALRLGIERRGRLVENEDLRRLQDNS